MFNIVSKPVLTIKSSIPYRIFAVWCWTVSTICIIYAAVVNYMEHGLSFLTVFLCLVLIGATLFFAEFWIQLTLDGNLLIKKTLFWTNTVRLKNIRRLSYNSGSGRYGSSGLDIADGKNGYISFSPEIFRQQDFITLIKKLQATHPKVAQRLQTTLKHRYPEYGPE